MSALFSSQSESAAEQEQPGKESLMDPLPESTPRYQIGEKRLKGKVAVITGGDSGIGRAVALLYAREGADVALMYLSEHDDAEATRAEVAKESVRCSIFSGDIGSPRFCQETVEAIVKEFGRIDILVNNAGEQHVMQEFEGITEEQLKRTFETNIFAMFYMTQAALNHMKEGSAIINTASVTAYHGSPMLIDYSATKGAIVSFTRSLSQSLAGRNIRVNAVAPGPIWTPLTSSTMTKEKAAQFGKDTIMKRAGQPNEVAPCYLFLACDDSSYMTGQTLHPNGGTIVNG